MIGFGVVLMFIATAIIIFSKSFIVPMVLYVIGLLLMIKGERKESQKIIIDNYGVRKQVEKVSNSEVEFHNKKLEAPKIKILREAIDEKHGKLSYFVSYKRNSNKWVAISNEWELIGENSKFIDAESVYGEDYAVVELFDNIEKCIVENSCKKYQI